MRMPSTMDYQRGLNDSPSEVPEPMRILMQENSRALDDATNSTRDSRLPKQTQG
jgi:hypothetical protein